MNKDIKAAVEKEKVIAIFGDAVSIKCRVMASKPDVITWYKNGRDVNAANARRRRGRYG